jgi:glutathione S-transferase
LQGFSGRICKTVRTFNTRSAAHKQQVVREKALITFYYASGSPYAWRAWLALEYKSLPYELKLMSFSDGDLKTPEYLRVSARGKVPAIEDDGYCLYESPTILEYLDEAYPDSGAPLFPGNAKGRAHIRRLINEADLYLDQANRKILAQVLFTQKEDWDDESISSARKAVSAELSRFETMFSGDYFAGELSAADFTIYPMVALMQRVDLRKPDVDMASVIGPKMTAWMQRVEALPFFSRTYPPHWKSK